MAEKLCVLKPLVMSKYCKLSICPDCGTVHFNLPCRITFQFEVDQFLEITDAFTLAAKIIKTPEKSTLKPKSNIVEFDRNH